MTTNFDKLSFINNLKQGLDNLPGVEAQYQMAPPHRPSSHVNLNPPEYAKKAGVLVLLYLNKNEWHLPMMVRTSESGPHSNQISFPGGKCEKLDIDIVHTATRESNEEMGIDINHVEVLGLLTQLYIEPSNFLVRPVLAWSSIRPDFKAEPNEVEKILEIPLHKVLDFKNRKTKPRRVREHNVQIPYFLIEKNEIWGASAMILSELVQLCQKKL